MPRVRITRKFAQFIDGIDLSRVKAGDMLDLSEKEVRVLLAEGWAERDDSKPQGAVTKARPRRLKRPLRAGKRQAESPYSPLSQRCRAPRIRQSSLRLGRRLLERAKGCVALRDSPRETLANLSITGHLRCFLDQPVAEIVQCGEPRLEGQQHQQFARTIARLRV
jgi:hypothetical protein